MVTMSGYINLSTRVSKVANVGCMSSNGLPRNYYGVLKEHLIAHVLRKQNEGSTPIQNLLYMVFVV